MQSTTQATKQIVTHKSNTENNLQVQSTEQLLPKLVLRNGKCSALYDSFVLSLSAVLRLNFCAKIPPQCKATKGYQHNQETRINKTYI